MNVVQLPSSHRAETYRHILADTVDLLKRMSYSGKDSQATADNLITSLEAFLAEPQTLTTLRGMMVRVRLVLIDKHFGYADDASASAAFYQWEAIGELLTSVT